MNDHSKDSQTRYFREAAIVLAKEGFQLDEVHTDRLCILLDGAPLCEVTESGGIAYRNKDIYEPERIAAKDKVYEIVRTTAEYMRQMETAPALKADGLENGYKVLADFNGTVLAGVQSKHGVHFVTWDWAYGHTGVCHGHYFMENYAGAKKADFVQSGTATEEMLDFLSACLRYGVSICVAGATSSGKTTVAGWLLSTIPDRKRIFTIEDGSRELQLIREHDGRVTNSVVHTQTRDSENERQRIDQIALLDIALRFNPDIICVGEMRGPEANAAQEAARVGIAVLTTIHSNSSEGTYRRMVSLCKRAVDTPDDTLMGYVTEAYPIVVYCRQLENKQRRITNISECEILPDGSRRLHKLYEYHITDNHLEGNRFIIEGEHRKCEEISESLRRRFIENGMPLGELAQFVQGKEEDE